MDTVTRWAARLVGAGMLGATAGIHAYLYDNGYKTLDKIGPMFLALVISASIMCVAVLVVPRALLGVTALGGALLEASTIVALIVFTNKTIFNFRESTQAPHYWQSIIVESIGLVALGYLAATNLRRRSSAP
jgi:uncharacterized protein (DUF486 family)